MSNDIPDLPGVPQEIRDAVDRDTLAVFIGAGVSRLVGCDGWDILAGNLVRRCHCEKIINFRENETLLQIPDHKKTITICHHLFKNKGLEGIFYEEMKKSFKENGYVKDPVKTPNIYDDISKLGGLFLTTNADTHFDRCFNSPNILYKESDFIKDRLSSTNLYHIHGSIIDTEHLIFTVSKYMKRYTNPNFKDFLNQIFSEYTVLFLGYGLEEFEILDFILRDNQRCSTGHFMLAPFYRNEENILNYEQTYYSDLGVKIIGYEKDENGYKQLIDVIRHWKEEIRQVTGYLHNTFKLIDKAMLKISKDEIQNTFQRIKDDKSLEDYFFNKLTETSEPLVWLTPLQNAGYFDPKNNPKLKKSPKGDGYYTPYWNVLGILKNMATKNENSPSDDVSKILLKIVDEIIEYRENKNRTANHITDWNLLEIISYLPVKYIGERHIQFIKDALRSKTRASLLDSNIGKLFLPKLIREKAGELIIQLLDTILHYRKPKKEHSREYNSVLSSYYLKEVLDKNKEGISGVCAVEAANIALKKMREILLEDNSQFSYVWIPTIEEHKQIQFPDRYECQLVHFARDMLETVSPSQLEPIMKSMFEEKYEIFQRLAYHLINHRYSSLSNLLWSINYNPLDISNIHELYELFKAHCASFETAQLETIMEWIESKKFHSSEERSQAYYKKEWLLALLGSGNNEVKRRYEAYNSINDAPIKHPGFHYWSYGVRSVRLVSPIDEDKFKSKTNIDIAAYINSYKEEDANLWKEDSTEVNLASSVGKFVSNDPVRFSKDLTPFLSVPRKYQYEFLRGFEEAWRNNNDFDWGELLPFMKKLIEDEDFWNEEKQEGKYDYNDGIVNTISSLIEDGTKDDKHAFFSDHLPIAERVLCLLLKNTKSNMSIDDDFIGSALNSSKGRVFMAAINYSLRYARLYSQRQENRWPESIKSDFTERLDKTKESGLDFSIVIGWHIPHLSYLDRQWVIDNFNRIFDLENDKFWEAAFTGYIVMTSTVYEEIYKLLRENGHYEKGLSYSFNDSGVDAKLVQNIVVGYLAGWDELTGKDGLLNKLLETGKPEYLSEVVRFMRFSGAEVDENFKNKVKPLWKNIIDIVSQNLKKDQYRIIASKLATWLSIVDTIDDDIYEWLKISAEFIGGDYNSELFIEYLRKHVSDKPVRVGKLYLKMLDSGELYPHEKENILDIVQTLYDLKEKETANIICNKYYSRGFHFLRETFEKYNKIS